MSLWKVSWRGAPPSTPITNTWRVPLYSPVKAIERPSGENFGNSSSPGCEVRRRATPPAVSTSQRSPA